MDEFSVQAYFKPIKKQENEEEPVELKGFDRISRMGYSPELISTIRTNFHTMNGTLDESDETRLNIEEEWFPVIFNQENPLDLLGIHTDNLNETTGILEPAQEYPRRLPSWLYLLIGFTLGTLFGFVSLIVLFVDMTNFFLVLGVLKTI
ncbi:DUF2407 C-terminal domain-containing protein [Histomonas meleagridis]|nr:DUF2407 C-terminal domain-containing protein [Histomonas meleagridis]